MTKFIMVIFSLVVLTACSQGKDSTGVESTSIDSTIVETSITATKSSTEEVSSSSTETAQNFLYAVNLNDFVQEVKPNGNEANQKTIYHLTFSTNKKNVPTTITLNTKDLNDFGNGIYISSDTEEVFYPVSINEIPTKTIILVGDNGKERKVKVNTEVKIEMPDNQSDSLQIVGDSYYLFYNQQETISLATRNLDENPGSKDLDNSNMIEYVQQVYSQDIEDSEPAENTKSDEYYHAIKEAWNKQKDYVDAIEDPKIKQATQTPSSAANAEAIRLEQENPEDAEVIKASLKRVLDGE
ncbi:hypothetical protein [Vagococcus bubulae]|uniref:Uncharacterized protein n=1 Tax=Vagococcus bubulae TaxID=1977868 RepID=A0A429ZD91_9ENTE|nr:hypothetical protein [Vagococcus bubulae]RST91678.1 hypothetical protein CBF36_09725 [Vagococcus bubulae]